MSAAKRYVFLDPDGTGTDQGWMFVVVAAPTGVVYQNQGGGYGCIPYEQEGYLIPVFGRGLDDELKQIFVRELKGWGSRGLDWPEELLARFRRAVAVHVYGSANRDDTWPSPSSWTSPASPRPTRRGSRCSPPTGPASWPGRTPTSRRAPAAGAPDPARPAAAPRG